MKFANCIVIAVFAVLFLGCGPDPLTREETEPILQSYVERNGYSRTVMGDVGRGKKGKKENLYIRKHFSNTPEVIVVLEREGLARSKGSKKCENSIQCYRHYFLPTSSFWSDLSFDYSSGKSFGTYQVKLCEIQEVFVEITGVFEEEENKTVVKYLTERTCETTQYYDLLPLNSNSRCKAAAPVSHSATFLRYDDGWRLEEVW